MQHAQALTPQGLLGRLFGHGPKPQAAAVPAVPPATAARQQRLRRIAGSASAERAARMLSSPNALLDLDPDAARTVVSYMEPRRIPQGTTFIREGDIFDTSFMLLVLDGEVTVESIVVSRTAPITVTVLGPGSLIGEMGLLDGAPRSASCTAMTDLRCAVLTRFAMKALMEDDPVTGAKWLMAISQRIAQRMRETQEKLKLYAQLTQAMNEEINELMPL